MVLLQSAIIDIITKKDDGSGLDLFTSLPEESGGEQFRLSGAWKYLIRNSFPAGTRPTKPFVGAGIYKSGLWKVGGFAARMMIQMGRKKQFGERSKRIGYSAR